MEGAYLHQLILNHHLREKQKHSCHLCVIFAFGNAPAVASVWWWKYYLDHQPRLGWKTRALPTASNQLQEASLCLVNDFGQLTSCL